MTRSEILTALAARRMLETLAVLPLDWLSTVEMIASALDKTFQEISRYITDVDYHLAKLAKTV